MRIKSGSINGEVYPTNTNESVVAINGNDSVRAVSRNGHFKMNVEPGMWKVIVGLTPRTNGNVIRENLEVTEGENINLGEIRLSE